MINFYDLVEDSKEIQLEKFSIQNMNEINSIITEDTQIVTEGVFSSIWNKIKSFFKKIGEFIKKWWNKFLKFLGIKDKDDADNNPPSSKDVENDANEVIDETEKKENTETHQNDTTTNNNTNQQQQSSDSDKNTPKDNTSVNREDITNDSNETESVSAEEMKNNLNTDIDTFSVEYDKLIEDGKERLSVGHGNNIEFDNYIFDSPEVKSNAYLEGPIYEFKSIDNSILGDKHKQFNVYKHCLSDNSTNEFNIINIGVLKETLISLFNPNNPSLKPFYRFIIKYRKCFESIFNNIENYNESEVITSISDANKILSEFGKYKDSDISLDYSKMFVKISSANNYYILRYSMQTSLLFFGNLYSALEKEQNDKLQIYGNKLTRLKEKLNQHNFNMDNPELINFINLTLSINNTITNHFIHITKVIGDIQKKINTCNLEILYKYINKAGYPVTLGKINFYNFH